jgi:protein-L-isoaspartate(D-aspartate) O-methyltransferase
MLPKPFTVLPAQYSYVIREPMTEHNYKAMRRAMVESQLRTSDVNDPVILEAILAEPREIYVPEEKRSAAYIDRAVPLANGRALNPPLATTRLLVEAAPQAGEKVLLVGAATGYAAALLARLGCEVVAIEEDEALVAHAKAALNGRAGVQLEAAPLSKGWDKNAPYDLLFVDGAVEELGEDLISQIRVDGRVVFARVEHGITRLCVGTRTAGGFGARAFADWEAVTLPGFARPKSFTF